jgi:phosphatidylserine/phosphatidylglycerophosphate/cardiolipin synthase-like enzyme
MIVLIGSEYPKKIIPLIESAKRNIDIVVYDWRWYPDQVSHPVQQFNMALVRAVQRGVIVRAVINAHTILPVLQKVGIKARQLGDKRTLHSKLIMVDETTLVIGSHNFTRNAFVSNIESSIVVEIPAEVTRFKEFFNNLYGL